KKSSRRRQKASDSDSSASVQGAVENQSEVVESSEAKEAPVKKTSGKSKKTTASSTEARG
ncbi:hypothetical protein, partial [Nostoc sp. CALU 546]